MIKLQDFAHESGVTDRQVQRLINKYETELEGHYERKGVNGTWIDEEGCQILKSKMKTNPTVVLDSSVQDELNSLKNKYENAQDQLIQAQQMIISLQNTASEAQKGLLEAQNEKKLLEYRQNDFEAKMAEKDAEIKRLKSRGFWERVLNK